MSTGYTYAILEGETFEDFVMRCTVAFVGEDVVDFDDDSYKLDIKNLEDEINVLQSMTHSQKVEYGESIRKERLKELSTQMADCVAIKDTYTAMLEKVESWEPPTDKHIGLKDFMIDQISISIKDDYTNVYSDLIKRSMELSDIDPIIIYERDLKILHNQINRTLNEYEKADLIILRQQWLEAIKNSLKTA